MSGSHLNGALPTLILELHQIICDNISLSQSMSGS